MSHTCRGTVNLAGAFIDTIDTTNFVITNGPQVHTNTHTHTCSNVQCHCTFVCPVQHVHCMHAVLNVNWRDELSYPLSIPLNTLCVYETLYILPQNNFYCIMYRCVCVCVCVCSIF